MSINSGGTLKVDPTTPLVHSRLSDSSPAPVPTHPLRLTIHLQYHLTPPPPEERFLSLLEPLPLVGKPHNPLMYHHFIRMPNTLQPHIPKDDQAANGTPAASDVPPFHWYTQHTAAICNPKAQDASGVPLTSLICPPNF